MNQILSLCFVLMPLFVTGQTIRKSLSAEFQRGWILPHNEELEIFRESVPFGFQLEYQRMGGSMKNWESCHCFHYLGVRLSVQDFGNQEELGRAISLTGSFEPLLLRRRRIEFGLNMGTGITYLTRVYDETTNPRNTFFSSPVSFQIYLSPTLRYRAGERFLVNASFSYNHISNGGQKKPNRGMNYPMIGIGASYLLVSEEYPAIESALFIPSWRFYMGSGVTLSDAESGGRKPVINLDAGVYRHLLPVIGLGGGVEWTVDQTIDPGGGFRNVLAIYLANHFLFGRFDFSQHVAWYVERPSYYIGDKDFYQRYLLEMLVSKHLRLGAGLKAHGHVAELLEIRAGWLF